MNEKARLGIGGRLFEAVIAMADEYAPYELRAWEQEVRLKMAGWTPYRNREIVWIKERTGPNGEAQVRTKEGQVMPKEVFIRKYERLESDTDQ